MSTRFRTVSAAVCLGMLLAGCGSAGGSPPSGEVMTSGGSSPVTTTPAATPCYIGEWHIHDQTYPVNFTDGSSVTVHYVSGDETLTLLDSGTGYVRDVAETFRGTDAGHVFTEVSDGQANFAYTVFGNTITFSGTQGTGTLTSGWDGRAETRPQPIWDNGPMSLDCADGILQLSRMGSKLSYQHGLTNLSPSSIPAASPTSAAPTSAVPPVLVGSWHNQYSGGEDMTINADGSYSQHVFLGIGGKSPCTDRGKLAFPADHVVTFITDGTASGCQVHFTYTWSTDSSGQNLLLINNGYPTGWTRTG
ncbi:hypothetical protein [Kitasatospora sp. KL5]|uniref:hypothetical protein n=1 Tax=Kitasatospora sp. KL5 TaxID=3425125 RepID=UPI003D6E935C